MLSRNYVGYINKSESSLVVVVVMVVLVVVVVVVVAVVVVVFCCQLIDECHTTKCGAGRICGADLNGDNLRISRAYLRISDHCRVRVRVMVRFRVVNCCIQTAGEGDKMRINHVIKTDQWRCAPQIRPAPHVAVSLGECVRQDVPINNSGQTHSRAIYDGRDSDAVSLTTDSRRRISHHSTHHCGYR